MHLLSMSIQTEPPLPTCASRIFVTGLELRNKQWHGVGSPSKEGQRWYSAQCLMTTWRYEMEK